MTNPPFVFEGDFTRTQIQVARIQRRRVKGWRCPLDVNGRLPVNVARPSIFGNPFRCDPRADTLIRAYVETPAACVGSYIDWLKGRGFRDDFQEQRREVWKRLSSLRGRNLMCFCPLFDASGNPHPCHGNELLLLANAPEIEVPRDILDFDILDFDILAK